MSYEQLPVQPQLVLEEEPQTEENRVDFESGDSLVWPQHHLARRSWWFRFGVSTDAEREQLEAFLRHHKGALTPFEHEITGKNPLPRPWFGPTVEKKGGGSTGARSLLYLALSYGDGTYETPVSFSPVSTSLAATETIIATCDPFPHNIDRAFVYVGTSLSALKKQTPAITVPTDGWAEPATGYDTGGDAPQTENTFTETVLIYASEDTMEVTKLQFNAWSIGVRMLERWAA
jgi:hypothetical protein